VATQPNPETDVFEHRVRGAGLELAVTERGERSRPTVLLVHGFPDTSAVWTPLAERMAKDFHVVTYDVRGAGRSDIPPRRRDYALRLLADDLAAVLAATSPDEPVHLVAHDWGSIQAWEAVTRDDLAGRFASYTSISGPPLDHAALWARSHRSLRPADLMAALRQAVHSWYIGFFHLPFVPGLIARGAGRNPRLWAMALHRLEGVDADATWPAATFGSDFAHGVDLYRANVVPRFRHPMARHTDTPVQIIVPMKDRYVTPALTEGLEAWSSLTWRREVDAGHWVIRTHAPELATWVGELIDFVAEGREAPELARCRVAAPSTGPGTAAARVA
jgi:pimeloyl-ACP methyl ester carboxylesterase